MLSSPYPKLGKMQEPPRWWHSGINYLLNLLIRIPFQNRLVSGFGGQRVSPSCPSAAVPKALLGCYRCFWPSALQVFFHQCDDDTYLSSGCENCWDDLAVPQGRQLFHALLNPNVLNYSITPTLKKAFFIILNLLPMRPSKERRFPLGWCQKHNPVTLPVK